MLHEQRHERYGSKPWPVVNNNWDFIDRMFRSHKKTDPNMELFCDLGARAINAILRTHGKNLPTQSIADSLGLNKGFLSKLARVCPSDSPLTIIGSEARWICVDSYIDENHSESDVEWFRKQLHLGYTRDEADIDIVVPDTPDVINLIVKQFPDIEFRHSRAAGDKLMIARAITKSGKEIEFHFFDDSLHPVIRNLVTAIDYPSTICIVCLDKTFYSTDLFGVATQVGLHRMEIPLLDRFRNYHKEHPNYWREFNYALRKFLKCPRNSEYYYDTKIALEDVFNRFRDRELQPEEARSICKNFVASIRSWSPTSSDMNKETVLMLGEADILKTIVEAALVSKDMAVIAILYYSFGRMLEYYHPHKDPQITQLQLKDFKDLYKGNWGIVDPAEAIKTCVKMAELPIGWFKSVNVGGNQYYATEPTDQIYNHNEFKHEIDDIIWKDRRKRNDFAHDLFKASWPNDSSWNIGDHSSDQAAISPNPIIPAPIAENYVS